MNCGTAVPNEHEITVWYVKNGAINIAMPSSTSTGAFYGYPSEPSNVSDSIRSAVSELRNQGFPIRGWEDMKVTGRVIIQDICREIDNCSVFCCDVTGLNLNVLFELGYAISKEKKVWITVDSYRDQMRADLAKFKDFTQIGYCSASSSTEVIRAFHRDQPLAEQDATTLNSELRKHVVERQASEIFYLKQERAQEAAVKLNRILGQYKRVTEYDPSEVFSRGLSWCVNEVCNSLAVVVHMPDPAYEQRILTARYAMIAGYAYGLGKQTLILAHETMPQPIDFGPIMQTYDRAEECADCFVQWYREHSESNRAEVNRRRSYNESLQKARGLQKVNLGDLAAEQDTMLRESFLETAAYLDALQGKSKIFLGRKGLGKTANLVRLSEQLSEDRATLVCVVKPPDYELKPVVALLEQFSSDRKLYLIQAIWRFLLLTEIGRSLALKLEDEIEDQLSEDEREMIRLLDRHNGLMRAEFSVRLEKAIAKVDTSFRADASLEETQAVITGALYETFINSLKKTLQGALVGKRRVAILVDNLDKVWDRAPNLRELSQFLFGLLSIADRLPNDIQGRGDKTVVCTVAIFLRKDIYNRIRKFATERDKISARHLEWGDRAQLLRVVENRFHASDPAMIEPADMWSKYFTKDASDDAQDYILGSMLPRPRDVIKFIGEALYYAVDAGRDQISRVDVERAKDAYSRFACETLEVESAFRDVNIGAVMYAFLGRSSQLSFSEIVALMKAEGFSRERVQEIVDELCLLSFLGIVVDGEVKYVDEIEDLEIITRVTNIRCNGKLGNRLYIVNPAYRRNLMITVT